MRILTLDTTFFKELPPSRKCTTWRCCYSPYSLPHTHHTCPCEFHLDEKPTESALHFATLHMLTKVTCASSLLHSSRFPRQSCTWKKKHCVCSENCKLYLGEISISQQQYQRRKNYRVTFRSTLVHTPPLCPTQDRVGGLDAMKPLYWRAVSSKDCRGKREKPREKPTQTPIRQPWNPGGVTEYCMAYGDWDFRISDLFKNLDGLIFNPCGEFRWNPEGPVSQIHSPHLHGGALGIFSDRLRSVHVLKRESGMRKATGSYRTYLSLVKLQPWFLRLQWKICPWA